MEATVWNQIQVVTYSILSSMGIFGHILLLIPLFKYYKTHFNKPFYTICISLALCDICNLLAMIINDITNPLLFAHMSIKLIRWKGLSGRFFWYGTTFHQFLISMERSLVVLCPPGSKLLMTRTKVFVGIFFAWVASILCNFCILTDYCPYIWYPNTTTIFYDYSVYGADLHNKIVDFGFQFIVIGTTVIFYIMAGVKIRLVRSRIQNKPSNGGSQKRNRLENILLLQGVFVSVPHTIVIILYHSIFFIPNLSFIASETMNFLCKVIAILGFGLNPVLHVILNKDLRIKTAETFCNSHVTEIGNEGTMAVNKSQAIWKTEMRSRSNVS